MAELNPLSARMSWAKMAREGQQVLQQAKQRQSSQAVHKLNQDLEELLTASVPFPQVDNTALQLKNEIKHHVQQEAELKRDAKELERSLRKVEQELQQAQRRHNVSMAELKANTDLKLNRLAEALRLQLDQRKLLASELKLSKAQIQQTQTELVELQSELARMEIQTRQKAQAQAETLTAGLNQERLRRKDAEARFSELQQAAQARMAELQQGAQARLSELQQAAKTRISELQQQNESQTQQHNQDQLQAQRLANGLKEERRMRKEAETRVSELRRHTDLQAQQHTQLQNQTQELTNNLNQEQLMRKAADVRVSELRRQTEALNAYRQRHEELVVAMTSLEADLKRLLAEKQAIESQATEVQAQLQAQIQDEVRSCASRHAKVQDQLAQAIHAVKLQMQQKQQLTEELRNLQELIKARDQTVEDLRREMSDCERHRQLNQTLAEKLKALERESIQLKAEGAALADQLRGRLTPEERTLLTSEMAKCEQALQVHRTQMEEGQKLMELQRQENETLKARLKALTETLRDLFAQQTRSKQGLADQSALKERVRSLEGELEARKSQEEANAKLKKALLMLKAQRDAAKKALETAKAPLEAEVVKQKTVIQKLANKVLEQRKAALDSLRSLGKERDRKVNHIERLSDDIYGHRQKMMLALKKQLETPDKQGEITSDKLYRMQKLRQQYEAEEQRKGMTLSVHKAEAQRAHTALLAAKRTAFEGARQNLTQTSEQLVRDLSAPFPQARSIENSHRAWSDAVRTQAELGQAEHYRLHQELGRAHRDVERVKQQAVLAEQLSRQAASWVTNRNLTVRTPTEQRELDAMHRFRLAARQMVQDSTRYHDYHAQANTMVDRQLEELGRHVNRVVSTMEDVRLNPKPETHRQAMAQIQRTTATAAQLAPAEEIVQRIATVAEVQQQLPPPPQPQQQQPSPAPMPTNFMQPPPQQLTPTPNSSEPRTDLSGEASSSTRDSTSNPTNSMTPTPTAPNKAEQRDMQSMGRSSTVRMPQTVFRSSSEAVRRRLERGDNVIMIGYSMTTEEAFIHSIWTHGLDLAIEAYKVIFNAKQLDLNVTLWRFQRNDDRMVQNLTAPNAYTVRSENCTFLSCGGDQMNFLSIDNVADADRVLLEMRKRAARGAFEKAFSETSEFIMVVEARGHGSTRPFSPAKFFLSTLHLTPDVMDRDLNYVDPAFWSMRWQIFMSPVLEHPTQKYGINIHHWEPQPGSTGNPEQERKAQKYIYEATHWLQRLLQTFYK